MDPYVKSNPKFQTLPSSTENLCIVLVELSGAACMGFKYFTQSNSIILMFSEAHIGNKCLSEGPSHH